MNTLCISFSFFFLIFINSISFGQSGWVRQPVNTTRSLIGMYFINDNTGWVVGDSGIICNTTNSGSNWVKSIYSGGGTLVSVYFKNH